MANIDHITHHCLAMNSPFHGFFSYLDLYLDLCWVARNSAPNELLMFLPFNYGLPQGFLRGLLLFSITIPHLSDFENATFTLIAATQ